MSEDGTETRDFTVSVIDNLRAYLGMMHNLFNWDPIKKLVQRNDFSVCIDGMHGVSGPYATEVFKNGLKVPDD